MGDGWSLKIIPAKFLVAFYKEIENRFPNIGINYKGDIEKWGDTVSMCFSDNGYHLLCVSLSKIVRIDKAYAYKPVSFKDEAKKVAEEISKEIEGSVGESKFFAAQAINPKNVGVSPDTFGNFIEFEVVYGILATDECRKVAYA